ncbi:MAG TPA: sialidase family protein [Ktedonobacteraceae bacterium]|nr:sialidase family protein [Ktedonobacteraceae bacterium]
MRISSPIWTRLKWPGRVGLVLAPTLLLTVLLAAHVVPLPLPAKTVVFGTPVIPNAFRQPLQLSSDPYKDGSSQPQSEVEPGAFAAGDTIVTAFQAGRYQDGGSANNGWATSKDDGHSWKSGFLPGTTQFAGGPYTRLSDPSVAYDAAHNIWLIASLAIVGSGSTLATHTIIVNISTDGGFTWSKPYKVVDGGSTYYDKDWITCDSTPSSPFYGHCYVEWDNNDLGGLILVSTSSDGGHTWSKPQTTADHALGIGGQPLVQTNGTVVVPISSIDGTHLLSFLSTNGGKSWSKTTIIAPVNGYVLATAAIDGANTIYVVWADCRFEKQCVSQGGSSDTTPPAGQQDDLVMSTSSDGRHWSAPRLIPADPLGSGVEHTITGLGVDPNTWGSSAHLALTFYYHSINCPSDCPYSVGFTSSEDGGKHWTPKIQIAGPMNTSWLPTGRNKVGDYISTVICNGLAFPFFSSADQPDANGPLSETIDTITGGLNV